MSSTPAVGHDVASYGPELPLLGDLGVGRCQDVAVSGNYLYAIGPRKLFIAELTDPKHPKLVGTLDGLGNNRQIVVRDHVAYLTAREDGLFIIDLADPTQPKLLDHYNTIELATGLALSGNVAYVACRHYGVELIDISNPAAPRHLSSVRTGEAQSCVARDGILYVGVWARRQVVICDVHNPRRPTILSKYELQGYGDGLCVRGDYCFAATGHHRRGMKVHDETDPNFGWGHGLEILNIHNPAEPKPVAWLQLPRWYRIGNDMWDVMVAGDRAYVGDTFNGLFIADIADLEHPKWIGQRQLPTPADSEDPSPVGGFDVGQGVLYLAGIRSDLHVVEAPLATPVPLEPDTPPTIPPAEPPTHDGYRIYQPAGQVYAATCRADEAWVACGSDGLHHLKLWPEFKLLDRTPTPGFAVDVKRHDDLLYTAEGLGGLGIYRITDAGLTQLGRLTFRSQSVKQVVLAPELQQVVIDVGAATLMVVDVSDPTRPKELMQAKYLGLLYGYNIADGLFEGRYAACMWHATGVYWFDLQAAPPVFSGDHYPHRMHTSNGLAVLPNGREGIQTISGNAYTLLSRQEQRPPNELPRYGLDGVYLGGKPVLVGNHLYVTERDSGRVAILDVTDLTRPKLIQRFESEGNPCLATEQDGYAVLPMGYQGLWVSAARVGS